MSDFNFTVKGLYIPIITPMLYGQFDKTAMAQLIDSVDKYVDGYVPCLSSGEGAFMDIELWNEVIVFVRSYTEKPVIAGIKREAEDEILVLAQKAKDIGCEAIIVPSPYSESRKNVEHFVSISSKIGLPMMVYNTETANISSAEHVQELGKIKSIIAIKDSSMNVNFFKTICELRHQGELGLAVLQGMEHQLDVPIGCDGYLVSLLNTYPELVAKYQDSRNELDLVKIYQTFMQYNLGADWYITQKALLFERGIIRSAEQIEQAIQLPVNIINQLKQSYENNL
ncbi:MAG: 4-hydroxy-tetrahydrodipicolinate synthase [Planctomycetota bacterium]|jgi:4-hydroxy-tetrahydrodipicolinate synthase